MSKVTATAAVLELGCGYGRVLRRLVHKASLIVGIDTAPDSLRLARQLLGHAHSYRLAKMNAARLGFRDGYFDRVICIQNGLSASKVDRQTVVREAVRVTRPGGTVLLSSYAGPFWPDRLAWFRLQAEQGLIGPIDEERTGNGVIICKDGFRATTLRPEDFTALTAALDLSARITEVDEASVFCEIEVKG